MLVVAKMVEATLLIRRPVGIKKKKTEKIGLNQPCTFLVILWMLD